MNRESTKRIWAERIDDYINANASIIYGDTPHNSTAAGFFLRVLSSVLFFCKGSTIFFVEEDGRTL